MPKKKATKKKVSRVPLTRAHGTMSEARFWSFVRSHLRRLTMKWKPKYAVKELARRKNQSENKRLKWQFQCNICKGWFPDKEVEVDHIVPCGSLKSFADLPGFVERMLCEVSGFRVLCTTCHNSITHGEKDDNTLSPG